MNGTPVTATYWHDPNKNKHMFPHQIQSYNISEKYKTWKSDVLYQQLLRHVTPDQPSSSLENNCTGSLLFAHGYPISWITIPCHVQFSASFGCTERRHRWHDVQNKNGTFIPFSQTICPDGWVKIYNICFMALKPETSASFYKAEEICRNYNATLPVLNKAYLGSADQHKPHMIVHRPVSDGLVNEFRNVYFSIVKSIINQPDYFITNALVGHPILITDEYRIYQEVLNALQVVLPDLEVIQMPARRRQGHMCIVLTTGHLQKHYLHGFYLRTGLYTMDNWGIKYRPCGAEVNAEVLLCEKPARFQRPVCPATQHQCDDKSCIQLFYVCDGINDCDDGADETICFGNFSTFISKSNISVYTKNIVTCHLSKQVDFPNNSSYIHINAFCDGAIQCSNSYDEVVCQIKPDKPLPADFITSTNYQWPLNTYKFKRRISRSDKIMWLKAVVASSRHLQYIYTSRHDQDVVSFEQEFAMINMSTNVSSFSPYKVECEYNYNNYFSDICRTNPAIGGCGQIYPSHICQHIGCPGMLKCGASFCVIVSAVCDGIQDCVNAEDEKNCRFLTCPGLFRCRSETTCLGQHNVCDGHVDCEQSQDDEVDCRPCPNSCICYGYTISCLLVDENSPILATLYYWKVVNIQLSFGYAPLDQISPFCNMLFLDFSDTELRFIKLDSSLTLCTNQLIKLNVSKNIISTLTFISHSAWLNLICFDASHNQIVNLPSKLPERLQYIYLEDNLLNFISKEFSSFLYNMVFLDVSNNALYILELHLSVGRDASVILVNVPDSRSCCLLPDHVVCHTVNIVYHSCQSIFPYIWLQWMWIAVAFIFSTLSIFVIIRFFIMGKDTAKGTGRHFRVIMSNIISSNSMLSLYFVVVSSFGSQATNLYVWKTQFTCKIIYIIFFSSLHGNMFFKIFRSIFVILKTVFPFKHQCRWLRFSAVICSGYWFLTISLAIAVLAVLGGLTNNMLFYTNVDQACTLFCVGTGTDGVSWLVILIVWIDFTLVLIRVALELHWLLNLQGKSNVTSHSKTKKSGKAVRITIISILPDIMFWLVIVIYMTLKLKTISLNISNEFIWILVLILIKLVFDSALPIVP